MTLLNYSYITFVACTAVSRQRPGKYAPAATDTHATLELLLETAFSIRSVERGYNGDKRSKKRLLGEGGQPGMA
jgi:hypothetical protein